MRFQGKTFKTMGGISIAFLMVWSCTWAAPISKVADSNAPDQKTGILIEGLYAK